ncbi:helix-turn-helix transcriptional regulator [Micromonospora sp. NBC_01699]|uniref:helix-turn-helix domain-containing protein n=1 Tax=Micromonospora sp. NBC_01699 TaxID=2975984 RepID=UPI002E366DEC|nr:helix-turn-helix transcriptional regulator [Micromonospora sp. NBC_01699]
MSELIEYVLEELRLARTDRDMSQEEFGKAIGYSGSHVSSVETGQRPPTPPYVDKIDEVFKTGGRYARMMRRLAKLELSPTWLRQWIEYEAAALTLRWYEATCVPGLMQTEAYARATLAGGRFTPEEVSQAVASRLDRQKILERETPPQLNVIIDEQIIHRPVLDRPGLMLAQCERIIELGELDHVQVGLVPADAGMYIGMSGQFIIAELPDGRRVAHADNQLRAQIVDDASDVARLAQTWEIVRNHTLPGRQSLQRIKEVAKTWT